jgi:hypothetical protein
MKSVKANGLTLHIDIDDWEPDSPRETHDNLGKMYGWHRRYTIGDENPYRTPQEFWNDNAVQDEIFTFCKVYLLDHSGLRLSHAPFACDPDGWDSGVLGVVYATKANALKRYGDLSEETKRKVQEALRGEIEDYDGYLNTAYCAFWIEGLDGESLAGCGGFACGDEAEMLKAMKECIDEAYYPLFDKALEQVGGSAM